MMVSRVTQVHNTFRSRGQLIWRKLKNGKPLFSCKRELYISKEVKENALASEDKSINKNHRKKSKCLS